MRRFWAILSLVLATFWVPASSHALLEGLGLIHEWHVAHAEDHDHDSGTPHEHQGGGHDLADGICRTEASGIDVPASTPRLVPAAGCAMVCEVQDALTRGLDRAGPSPPGTSPPGLLQVWRFSFRAALPVRAPSLVS